MVKGLLIMLTVFLCVAILHFVSLRILKFSESRKLKARKIVWYFYGIYFLGYGIYLIVQNGFDLNGLLFSIIGLFYIVMNFRKKIPTIQ